VAPACAKFFTAKVLGEFMRLGYPITSTKRGLAVEYHADGIVNALFGQELNLKKGFSLFDAIDLGFLLHKKKEKNYDK
jgi:hypothetical protein